MASQCPDSVIHGHNIQLLCWKGVFLLVNVSMSGEAIALGSLWSSISLLHPYIPFNLVL